MLRVADLMQKEVQTIRDDAPVSEAIMLLADARVGALPVLDAERTLVGVLSATDILAAEAESEDATALNQVATDMAVRDLMTPTPRTVAPDVPVKQAAQEMLYLDVHRLLVVEDDTLVGVISQSDIVRAVASGAI